MKLSMKWLAEFVNFPADMQEYSNRLTLTGSKVEAVEDLGAEIQNVVLGQILALDRHENADTLWVCSVDIGAQEPTVIVTGAQNLKVGDFCPVALHKSTLPGGVEIKRGKLRGVVSNGMLGSLDELALDTHDYPAAVEDGILTFTPDEMDGYKAGDDIRPILGKDDTVVEFEITSNRPDCLSVIGLARETAASFDSPLIIREPVVKGSGGDIAEQLDVEIWDEDLCARYTARLVKNVKIAPSPAWLRQRLCAMGVRPINNIVDITNYVMLEYGQPMHAFDYTCLDGGKIIVRRAAPGEEMTTLDEQTRKLEGALVIADTQKAVGIAGVMGGFDSEITDSTTTVVFESANFDRASVRKTSARLRLRTDASSRFEKGLDVQNTLPAIQRACELVEQLDAGEVVAGIVDVIADRAADIPPLLTLDAAKINALLGTDISRMAMVAILEKLGFAVDAADSVTVPSWRSDVREGADLAEEVARFYGYNEIPETRLDGEATLGGRPPRQKQEQKIGVLLRGFGYNEILTYTFTGTGAYDKARVPAGDPRRHALQILNPLGEDTSIMRTIAVPAMLETLARNYHYRNESARLYELARVYRPDAQSETGCTEALHLTLGAYGGKMDFFALKGTIEALFAGLNIPAVQFVSIVDDTIYHPGRCAEIRYGEQVLGRFGQVHPKTAQNYDIDSEFYTAELDVDTLLTLVNDEKSYTPLPKYPATSRDIAVVCDAAITVADLQAVIERAGSRRLTDSRLFDIYTGAPIPAGKKSVAFALSYRADDRTLTDEDADKITAKILDALQRELDAVIR